MVRDAPLPGQEGDQRWGPCARGLFRVGMLTTSPCSAAAAVYSSFAAAKASVHRGRTSSLSLGGAPGPYEQGEAAAEEEEEEELPGSDGEYVEEEVLLTEQRLIEAAIPTIEGYRPDGPRLGFTFDSFPVPKVRTTLRLPAPGGRGRGRGRWGGRGGRGRGRGRGRGAAAAAAEANPYSKSYIKDYR